MAERDRNLLDRLSRAASWRGSRRRAGGLAAALLAALTAPDVTRGHGKHRSSRRSRENDKPTPVGRRFCGGKAGLPCPKGFICIDDPDDGCDPRQGGMDCGGICVRKRKNPCARIRCAAGTVCCPKCGGLCLPPEAPCSREWCTPRPCNQATCQPGEYCCSERCSICAPLGATCRDDVCLPEPGVQCGDTVCGPGEFCCNPNCGQCAPIDGACTNHYCPPPEGIPCGTRVCAAGEICCPTGCGHGGMCVLKGVRCPLFICPPRDAAD